jgi:hypothetical protein
VTEFFYAMSARIRRLEADNARLREAIDDAEDEE